MGTDGGQSLVVSIGATVPGSQVREGMPPMGNMVGEGHLPRSLIHCRLQQPYLLVQGTSHTQDLPTGTQMLVARDLAPTISTATSPHPRQARRGGCVLLSPSLWPGEDCGSPSGAVDWGLGCL